MSRSEVETGSGEASYYDPASNLGRALSSFLRDSELVGHLAQALAYASKRGRVSYDEIEGIIRSNPEDVLLLGNEWRLLLPMKTVKSAAWEDRLLLPRPGEVYEVPNIVRYLVENASRTGLWNPRHAIASLFREMGEPDWQRMPELVKGLERQAKDGRITATQIKKVCGELGLGDRVNTLIAELKGSGVMSPKLGLLTEASRAWSPIYELNPSLF